MPKKTKLTSNERNLTRRYLIWCYKTTKEELDKVDRYYTQLNVDRFVLEKLRRNKAAGNKEFLALVDDFSDYMEKKKANVDKKKFTDTQCQALDKDYLYLNHRFFAIEQAIVHFLGRSELKNIADLYEAEMSQRILSAREHS